ncbi:MAG: hypothetical protein WCG81_18410 [Candidatus Angelobacter sp.]
MTHEIAAANKELVRRFYKEVYVNWNMAVADDVISPQFKSHDWPEDGPERGKLMERWVVSDLYGALAESGALSAR